MREDWTYKKLGEIATISAGQGAPQGDSNYSSDGKPFIKAGNLESLINGLSEFDIQKVTDKVAKSHRLKLYKAGSVLFAKSGMSCMKGWVYTTKNECYVVSHLAIVTPNSIDSHFLNYYFQVNKPNTLIQDSAYPSISLRDIEKLLIPVPPISEQERIVSELDLLTSIIEKKKAQLKELDNLAQSIFYDMFGDPVTNEQGWEVKKLGEVCDVRDGTHDSPKYIEKSEYLLITSKNIQGDNIIFEGGNYISEEDYNNINKRSFVDDGDIIMAMIGTIGKPIIVQKNNKKFCIKNVALIKFSQCTTVLNSYIKAMLICPSYMHYIHGLNKGGTQKFVALGTIRGLSTPLPPISLQQQFAEKIEAIEHQKELIQQSITETETLFNSRMDYYFN